MQLCHVCRGQLKMRFAEVADPQTGETFSIIDCDKCGAGQTFPQPENLSSYYVDYHGSRHGLTLDYCNRRRVFWLERSFTSQAARRVLDVGCGDGTFLRAAKMRGWLGVGTEQIVEEFHDSDLELYGDLADVKATCDAESFDAITIWHTLEHFRNPRQILQQIFELLAPEGVLLIAVPDARGWQARFFGKFWFHLDVPRHLFHFGIESLALLLRQCGFTIRDHWHQEFEYDLLGWSQSSLNCIFGAPNVFFKALTGKQPNVSRPNRVAQFALGTIFSVVSLPLVLFGSLRENGGTLVIRASKMTSVSQ